METIQVGYAPDGIDIDPTTSKAYVTNSKGNTVDIIDLKTNAVVGKLNPIGAQPEAVAVDPSRNKAYVANFKDNTVSVIKLPLPFADKKGLSHK